MFASLPCFDYLGSVANSQQDATAERSDGLVHWPHHRDSHHALAWHLLVGFVGSVLGWGLLEPSMDHEGALRGLSWLLIVLLASTLATWRLAVGGLFDPYVAFLVAAYLFNGGLAFLWAVGLEGNFSLPGHLDPESIRSALALTGVALWAMHLGALLARGTTRSEQGSSVLPTTEMAGAVSRVGVWLVLVAGAPAIAILAHSARLALADGYFALYQRDLATGWDGAPLIVANLMIPGVFSVAAGSAGRGRWIASSVILVFVWSTAFLFIGYRGTGFAVALAFIWLWSRRVRQIRAGLVFGIALPAAALLIPLVQATRGLAGTERLNPAVYADVAASIDAPVVAAISEMGGTLGVTAETIELVPGSRALDLGRSYAYAILAVLPNIAWDVHPSVARGTPSDWFIWAVEPVTAAAGGGRGFSFIAEAYLNFGYLSPLATLALGLFLGFLQRRVDQAPDEAKDAFLASYLVFLLPYARADSMMIVRPLLWYAGVPYLVAKLVALRSARHGQG